MDDIYFLWNYAADLAKISHALHYFVFYLFSGRSDYMHCVGKGLKMPGRISPGVGVLVTLDVLMREHCIDILRRRGLAGWETGNAFEWFYKYTGGIPRVVGDMVPLLAAWPLCGIWPLCSPGP